MRLAKVRSLHSRAIRVLSADGCHGLQVSIGIDLAIPSRVVLIVSLGLDVRHSFADVAGYT